MLDVHVIFLGPSRTTRLKCQRAIAMRYVRQPKSKHLAPGGSKRGGQRSLAGLMIIATSGPGPTPQEIYLMLCFPAAGPVLCCVNR